MTPSAPSAIGYAAAEDRLLQMDLFRRRATGRLAEVFGEKFLDSDRKFRVAGMERHCREAASGMPADIRAYLTGYAAGVNAWVAANPDKAARRMAPLGTPVACGCLGCPAFRTSPSATSASSGHRRRCR